MSKNKEIQNQGQDLLELSQIQAINYARDFSVLFKQEKKKRKALEIANFHLQHFSQNLNSKIEELDIKNKELNGAYLGTLNCLALAASYKDEETGDHIIRMSRYSEILARKLDMPEQWCNQILHAAPMHDIGKIGIPDHILRKPGKLNQAEFEEIKKHTMIGPKILSSKAPIIKFARKIAVSHHEKWNGTGYPSGLAKDKIPLEGRVVALADVFDALTSERPYKRPYPVDVACDIIRKEREAAFDPQVVDAFFNGLDDILKVKHGVDGIPEANSRNISWSERDIHDKTITPQ